MTAPEKAASIISGWKNWIFRRSEYEAVARQRLEICVGCEYLGNNKCKKCGCQFNAKIRSMGESCPIGKWGAANV